ncbi:MAG: homocysteine S-methyltransferase family protein, partial [Myxococcota bacterium]|nr:homocysteine S-methyltransferase family protein [Myxococcota bacterium]
MAAEYNGGAAAALRRRVAEGPVLVLDGATGTELERRGIACDAPLWSAHALERAPETVARVHPHNVAAGGGART